MIPDDDLIRAAQQWATGATIHNTNVLIGCYRGYALLWKNARDPESKQEFAAHAEREARTLREFMTHGDYNRARRENPPPGGWTRPETYRDRGSPK